ncbi:TPA: DnaT-like ssDNA-binding protein [Salmonella enterica subsp. enterica serovar Enteritidis]
MAYTLVVEDGSIVPGANSYVSAAEVDEFITNEGILIQPGTDPYYQAAKAAIRLDNQFNWLGRKVSKTQSMAWPRTGLGACNVDIAESVIPREVKLAQLYMMASVLSYDGEEGVRSDQALRRKKVGNLEIEYFDSKSGVTGATDLWTSDVKTMLKHLVGASLRTRRV